MNWKPIATAPRDGTNILIRFGQDGTAQAKYIAGLPNPWQFIDTNDGITWLINHAKDTNQGGPSHWMEMPTQPAPVISPFKITGLGSITDDDDGVMTLRFVDEAAAKQFMCDYSPTVESDDMPAPASVADKVDAERLDFVIDRQAFIMTIPKSKSGLVAGYQLMEQDEYEDYHELSGDGIMYRTKREAIDAAIEKAKP